MLERDLPARSGLLFMSALGQKRTFGHVRAMSALPPKADIGTHSRDVRFVPKADSCTAANRGKKGLLMLPPVALVASF